MKVLFFSIVLILTLSICSYSQVKKANPFQRVNVPDSIYTKLEKAYNRYAENVNAGRNVFNLINRKEFNFKDGIYSFQGHGPHFPR